jgi:DNA-binding MarR family transcriptional regulator
LAEICDLDDAAVVGALDMLVKLNLVDVRGDLYQRRYTIHNLTRTFLHEQVLRWQN